MRFLVLVNLFFLFCSVVFAEVIPLSIYSDKEYLGNEQWQYVRHGVPQYYLENNELTLIDSNFEGHLFDEWPYQVNKGLYSLGAKEGGTIGFRFKNKGLTLKLIGLGFYNSDTKERIVITGITLNNPVVSGNRVSWELPYESSYFLEYNNKHFKDVVFISNTIKTYLLNHKPVGWTKENSWVGLIYQAEGFNLSLADFDSNESVYFFGEQDKPLFFLPPRKVYHELHQSGEGDFNNDGLEWQKKRVYYNGFYVEAVPVAALESVEGGLLFNADIKVSVNTGSDDGDESGFGVLDLTDIVMLLTASAWGSGIMFRDIPIPQGTTISEATLELTGSHSCDDGCNSDVFGVDEDDAQTWSATNKMSTRTKTTASTTQDLTGSFVANALYTTYDINVTDQVQEIINRVGWVEDNNMAFVIDQDGFYLVGNSVSYSTLESTYPEPKIIITYEGEPPDPCEPDLDEDWVFSNYDLFCLNKTIVSGTGNLYFDSNSSLTLKGTKMLLGSFVSIKMPPINAEWITEDGNINVINAEGGFPKSNASHKLGGDQHAYVGWWQSKVDQNDHYIEVDLKNNYFVREISLPLNYIYKRYIDINITYYNGLTWNTLFQDSGFNMGVEPDDCDWNGYNPTGIGIYWCDINKSVNQYLQKIRFSVDSETAIAGAKYDLNILAVGDIILRADYPRSFAPLILNDSNFSGNQ